MLHKRFISSAAALAFTTFSITSAWSHAFMVNKDVPAGSWQIVEIAIPHGCKGTATNTVKIKMPVGVFNARPEVKAGWDLSVTMKTLPEPIQINDLLLTEIVDEITWSGGNLNDLHMERFSFMGKMPSTEGEILYFPIVQLCEDGEHRWIEIPEEGRPWSSYKEPAPFIKLGPAARPGPPTPATD